MSDQLPPGPELQGATTDSAGDSVPHSSATECSCPHGPALVTQQKGTSGTPSSPASSLPPEHRPDGQGPLGTTVLPGPTSTSQSSRHPCKPPRGKATASPGSPRDPDGHPEKPRPADRKLCPSGVDTSSPPKMTACPSLQEAMRLIQEEFAFDGYMDNGLEALIMGMKTTGATLEAQDKGEIEGGRPSPESISMRGTRGHTSVLLRSVRTNKGSFQHGACTSSTTKP